MNTDTTTPPAGAWQPGTVAPVSENPSRAWDYYLTVRHGNDDMRLTDYWFHEKVWRNEDGIVIQVDAWMDVPTDGLDEAIRRNDSATKLL
jgi:hypothetical protein